MKNFQLQFAPEAFRAEIEAWRAVIHLNLIRSVNFILDLLTPEREWSLSNADPNLPSGDYLRPLRMRLSPLRQVEVILVQRLSGNDPSRGALNVEEATPWYYGRASEVSIRSGSGWKSLLRRKRNSRTVDNRPDELDNARQILHSCREDIVNLWTDPVIQTGLRDEGVSLQEQSGL